MSTAVGVLIFDGYADWEPALACAEVNKSSAYHVETVGFDAAAVTSMGGLRVQPARALHTLDAGDIALLILPGGNLWESGEQPEVTATLQALAALKTPLACICAATIAAAHAGLLDERAHTSNYPGYIGTHAPAYLGAAQYREVAAVSTQGVITASGMGSVEFAFEILRELRIYSEHDLALWLTLFRDKTVPAGLLS